MSLRESAIADSDAICSGRVQSVNRRGTSRRIPGHKSEEHAVKSMLILFAMLIATPALAQDVPGIEICTAEKTWERRTSCLQSNIDFLKKTITKAQLDSQQRIDAANRQIDALKATVAALQIRLETLEKKPPVKESDKDSKPAAK